MYRTDRYTAIMAKLNRIQASDDQDHLTQKYEILQNEVNEIIESLRNRSEQANAKVHYLLLIVPLILILLWHSWLFHDYLNSAITIILMLTSLALIHFRIGLAIRNSTIAHDQNPSLTDSQEKFISRKLEYLNYALDIKKTRLVLLALFYIIFFPILLVKLYSLAAEQMAFDDTTTAYLVAFLIGGSMWFIYYNRSFEQYDSIDEEIQLIQESL